MAYAYKKEEWERMGLCTKCGGLRLDPAYRMCTRCRERNRANRTKKIFDMFPESSEVKKPPIRSDHKCWSCEWANFLGDRFFCPFIEGTCAKEKK